MLKLNIGVKGEKAACAFLKKAGYKILERNYRKKYGEIDIIAQKGDTVSFVEVKTRGTKEYGLACQAVTKHKINRILKTAHTYIKENKIDFNYSFDIIEVYHKSGKIQEIKLIDNAISFWN